MTLTDAQIDALTDAELNDLQARIQSAWTIRVEAGLSAQRIDDAVRIVHARENPGDPWVQPASKALGYPLGAVRSHAGSDWISTDYANVSEPGTVGAAWAEVTGAHPVWDPEQIYGEDTMVAHLGRVWVSLRPSNATEPGTPAGRWHWSLAEGETP